MTFPSNEDEMNDTKALLDALSTPFPREAIKQRRQGNSGKALSYVEGFTVIRRLNAATGGRWSWQIKSFEFRPLPPTSNGNEQSLIVVTGELTIDGLGTRAGVGVQKVVEASGEDLVKGASTDALKKAATLFGVGLELYGEDYEGGQYDINDGVIGGAPKNTDPGPAPARPAPPRQQPQAAPPAPPVGNGSAPASAKPPLSPAITRDADWTDVWGTARTMGIKDRAALDQWLGGEGAKGLQPWQILARLKEATAQPPASYAG